ncbi:Zinc finger MYM-type protein 5 [Merluccius polli]|uniref:Zinc finger MYM-type protein 5 n=1 Tax=Merluccius polli TaxID=89951 RepID=A0AA47NW88_MERPO|nr:Zinc finger MYM-type protein 5 [Merluccius polli]
MLKFVTQGDTEPAPSTSQGPSSTMTTEAASPSISPGPSSNISSATDATITTPSAQPVDPALWPAHLSDVDRVEFVSDFTFPKTDGQVFILANGDMVTRSWFVYSKHNNSVFCFACKLFSVQDIKLTTEGLSDWFNINAALKSHDNNSEHTKSMLKCKGVTSFLKVGGDIF